MELRDMSTEEILATKDRWSYVRTDRNGTRYFANHKCEKCGGHGYIQYYAYVDGGVCFDCGGSGLASKPDIIKVYTAEHEAKLTAQREARATAKREAKLKELREGLPQKMADMGVGMENDGYVVYRVIGNTYSIKDALKELGCKFNPCFGWYRATNVEGYECQRMVINNYFSVNEDALEIEWVDPSEVKKMWSENLKAQSEVTSEFQGVIGGKLDLRLHIDRAFEGNGYAYNSISYMYVMSDEAGNKYKWSTSVYYAEGSDVHFKATVKDHVEYEDKRGVVTRQTVLTRCTKVKE